MGVHLVAILEVRGLEVSRGHASQRVERLDVLRRPELRVVGPGLFQVHHRRLADLRHALGVGQRDIAASLHRDSLELLRAHDRARTAAPEGPVVDVDVGKPNEIFTRRADGHGAALGFPERFPQQLQRAGGRQALPRAGITELHLAVADGEVRPVRSPALDDQPVEACLLQLGPEVSPAVGAEVHPRLRRLGGKLELRCGHQRRAGERAGEEEDLVLFPQLVNSRRDLVPVVFCRDASSAQEHLDELFLQWLRRYSASTQVHAQHPAAVTFQHIVPLREKEIDSSARLVTFSLPHPGRTAGSPPPRAWHGRRSPP